MGKVICGICKYHQYDGETHCHYCHNENSYYNGYTMEYNDSCGDGEVKDIAIREGLNIQSGGTLIVPVSKNDIDRIKRVILDCKPWCKTFYEDAPGEAHWIKTYITADGDVYECDNCGVAWAFNDGGPEENEAYYCPKCGFKMVPKEGEKNGQN